MANVCTNLLSKKIDVVARLCHSNKIINKFEIRNARSNCCVDSRFFERKISFGRFYVRLFLSLSLDLFAFNFNVFRLLPFIWCFLFYFHAFRTRALIRIVCEKCIHKQGALVYLFRYLSCSLSHSFVGFSMLLSTRDQNTHPTRTHGLNKIYVCVQYWYAHWNRDIDCLDVKLSVDILLFFAVNEPPSNAQSSGKTRIAHSTFFLLSCELPNFLLSGENSDYISCNFQMLQDFHFHFKAIRFQYLALQTFVSFYMNYYLYDYA